MSPLRSALPALLALPIAGCFSWNLSRDPGLDPPDRPRVDDPVGGKLPEWMRNPPVRDDERFEPKDVHRATHEESFVVDIRLGVERHELLEDRSAIRIDLPVGYVGHRFGLAELAALAVADAPGSGGDRLTLRDWITRRGGDLLVDVGAKRTRLTVHVPTPEWETVLNRIAERLRGTPITQAQLAHLQHRLVRLLLDQWETEPAFGYAVQWSRYGEVDRNEVVASIQDRYPEELVRFQRRHYRPDGSVVRVWVPEVDDPKPVVASTRFGLSAWQAAAEPSEDATQPPAPPRPSGVRWIEGDGLGRIAILIPLPSAVLEWRVMLECLTMSGVGGRLGETLQDDLDRDIVFEVREIGDHDGRFLVLETVLEAKAVPVLWNALNEAWKSLGSAPPIGTELTDAKARLRLRLARRQDETDEWLDAAGARAEGGPVRDLHALAKIDHVRAVVPEWSATRLAMVVAGGAVPEDAPVTFTKTSAVIPEYGPPTPPAAAAKETKRLLELAVKAVGDRRTFAAFRGYELEETWTDAKGLAARAFTRVRPPSRMSRSIDVLGARITTSIQETGGKITATETVGEEERELTADEVAVLRDEANRHPLALLADWVQGRLEFRLIGHREWMGRRVALLERVDATRSRMRITVDAKSGLLRTVETIRHGGDEGPVLVREAYDDYRRTDAFRVPMHRVTQVGSDEDGVDAVVQSFRVLDR